MTSALYIHFISGLHSAENYLFIILEMIFNYFLELKMKMQGLFKFGQAAWAWWPA
jgi:hypothetical protein